MLAAHRRAHILAAVDRDGTVKVAELAHRLGVSDMTVRADQVSVLLTGRSGCRGGLRTS